jgi:hypothetical protein
MWVALDLLSPPKHPRSQPPRSALIPYREVWANLNVKLEIKNTEGNWNSLREVNIRNGLLVVILMCGEWSKHDLSVWN